MLKSSGYVKGTVNVVLRGKDNRVKQHKTIRNRVMNNGLAHIVGRMIDHKQNGGSFSTTGTAFALDGTTKLQQHDMPRMMRYMGIGKGAELNTDTAGKKGIEFKLQNEVTTGSLTTTSPQNFNRISGVSGTIVDIDIVAGGSGYTSSSDITLTIPAPPSGGVQATATATVTGGIITSVAITNRGSGYTATAAQTVAIGQTSGSGSGGSIKAYVGAVNNGAARLTRVGRVDMGALNFDTNLDPTAFTTADWAALRPAGAISSAGADVQKTVTLVSSDVVSKSTVTNLFQGDIDASGTLTADTGTAEYASTSTFMTNNTGSTDAFAHQTTGAGNNLVGKRTGKKLVYIALFPPNAPRDQFDTDPNNSDDITEAGIFNSPFFEKLENSGSNEHPFSLASAGGTMLCRTQFNQVSKYKEDSLQITWTIDFSDNTTV